MPDTIARSLARRVLQVAAAVILTLLMPALAGAQTTFTVANETDLRAALTTAVAGDTIVFSANITLTQDLPSVAVNVTLDGATHTLSGNNQFRGLVVAAFNTDGLPAPVAVTIQNLTITNTVATGGSGGTGGPGGGGGAGLGGALFVASNATVSVSNVDLSATSAVGGSGGASAGFGDGGGGGGLGGAGGTGGTFTGAGGGGGAGNTASGGTAGGGGGAGILTGAFAGGFTLAAGGTNGGGGAAGVSGSVGAGGGSGGTGSSAGPTGGSGGFGGGGGGASLGTGTAAGSGGFGGGGGGGGDLASTGGFGGGGGGSTGGAANAGGTFGGAGGTTSSGGAGGGGGAGLGGAIFVQAGGAITVGGGFSINGAAVTGGTAAAGGVNGSAAGSAIFIGGNQLNGASGLTFAPAAGQTATVSNDIADQFGVLGSGSSASVTINGAGTVVLSGNNLYSGGTSLSSGILSVASDANLGLAGTTLFGSGGSTLQITGTGTFSRDFALGSGTQNISVASGQTATWSGAMGLESPGGINVTGGGTLALTNAFNLFAGGSSVNGNSKLAVAVDGALSTGAVTLGDGSTGGTLGIDATSVGGSFVSARGITLQNGGGTVETVGATDATLAGTIDGAGGLTKIGTGVLRLTGNNSYAGATTVDAGTLQAGSATAFGLSSSLSVGAAGTADFNGFSQSFFSIAGTGTIALNTGSNGLPASLTVGGDNSNSTFGGTISGTGGLAKAGAGTLTLSGTSTFGGGLALNGGTVNVSFDANLGGAGAVSMSNGTTLGLTSTGAFAHDLQLAGTGTVNVGAGQVATWTGLVSDNASQPPPPPDVAAPSTFGTLQVTGGGTFALTNAANSYAGGTIVTGNSTLAVAADGALGAAGTGLALGDATSTATLGITTAGAFGSARAITLGALGATIDTAAVTAATLAGTISGTGGLTKDGAGTLTLSGTNTFSGGLALFGGTVNVSTDANLGGAGAVSMIDGTTLGLTSTGVFAHALQLSGTSTVNVGAGQAATWNGLVSDNFSFSQPAQAPTVDGPSTGGTLQVTGGGTLALTNAANSYSGGTIVTGGSTLFVSADGVMGAAAGGLALGDAGSTGTLGITTASAFASSRAITLGALGGAIDTGASTATLSGVIGGTGGLIKDGSGSLTLTGTNTFAGGLALFGGTVSVATDANLGGAGAVSMIDGTTLGLTSTGVFAHALQLSGTSTVNVGAGQAATWNGLVSDNFSFSQPAQAPTVDGPSTGGTLQVTGGGTLALTNTANSYAGGTSVTGGSTLSIGADGVLGVGGGLTLGDATSTATLGITTTGAFSSSRAIALGAQGATIDTAAVTAATLAGAISGTGGLTKTGDGSLALTGANTYTGPTAVLAGVLTTGHANAFGQGGGLSVGASATINLNGFGQTVGSISGAGALTLGGGATLTLGGDNSSSLFAGTIGGTGALVKSGSGQLTLTGTNTFTGGTAVNGGALVGTTNSLQGNIVNNAQVGFAQAFDGTYTGVMSGTGALIKTGLGALTLTGANTYSGGTFLNAGSIIGTTTSLQGAIVDNGTLVFNQAFDGSYGGLITGSGGLTKLGIGTVSLSGAQGYTGLTRVGQGTLAISGLAGSVIVDFGAALRATGVIGGSLDVAGSLFVPAPGSQFGAITRALAGPNVTTVAAPLSPSLSIAGNLTTTPGSTFGLSVAAGGVPTIFVGGRATLVGTHFDVTISDPNPSRVATYLALSAAGGLSATNVTVSSPSTSLVPVLKSDSFALTMTLLNLGVPLGGVATSPNGIAAGRALDAGKFGATGDFAGIVREVTALDNASLDPALRALSGEIHASQFRLIALDGLANTDLVRNELSDREHDDQDGGSQGGGWAPRPWFQLSGDHASFGSGDFSGGSANVGGGGGGLDFRPASSWTLGGGGALSLGGLSLSDVSGTSQMTAPRAFAYSGFAIGPFHVHFGSSVSRSTTTTTRSIQFIAFVPDVSGNLVPLSGGIDRTATSDQVSTARDAWSEWQYTDKIRTWTIDTKLGLRYASYTRQEFGESGADSISLESPTQTLSNKEANVDFHLFRRSGTWRPNILVTYRREFGAEWTIADVSFAGNPASQFAVQGLAVPRNTFQGLFGITMKTKKGLLYTLEYQTMQATDESHHSLRFKVRFW